MRVTATWNNWSRIFNNHFAPDFLNKNFQRKHKGIFKNRNSCIHFSFYNGYNSVSLPLRPVYPLVVVSKGYRHTEESLSARKKDNSVVFSVNTCPNTFSRKSCLTSNPDRSTTASPRVNRSRRKNHRLSRSSSRVLK